ncbi:MAG: glycoside hydrolase family 28 protein [Epulopiscium sp.]|nr:glycoside hydrolase family 28 protein [Candidatus Epulonipiscium sp.]
MKQEAWYSIEDFGAVGDGKTLCTDAFAAAMAKCEEQGGGTVYVPAGKFFTGPIHLTSNLTLYIDAGATVVFTQDLKEYPVIDTFWEGADCKAYSPQIYGKNLKNVAIVGRGKFDGQGDFWWKNFRAKTLNYVRPRMVSFENCQDILIEGIQLVNSPSWTVHPLFSESVTVDKITIRNPYDSPNTDGINPESCKNVRISNCHIDVGDDCIAIKAGTEDCSIQVPCENIVITNCTMVHGHGGVVIGSEMSSGIRNITISNCVFEGTDRGIRLKTRRGRGGVVEDIRVTNIIMKKVFCPFVLNLYYFCGKGGKDKFVWDKNPYPVTKATPAFRRIYFSNITALDVQAAAGFIYGLPEMPIEDIGFENISIYMDPNGKEAHPAMMSHLEPMKQQGFFCTHGNRIFFDRVDIHGHTGEAFHIEQSEDVEFSNCHHQRL